MKKELSARLAKYFPVWMQWVSRNVKGDNRWKLRKEILHYYQSEEAIDDEEIKEAVAYIRTKGVGVFPFSFTERYDWTKVAVYHDLQCNLKYVIHENKRLYFPVDLSNFRIQKMYTDLLMEQDSKSAHCYQTQTFSIDKDDILFDIGAAEGILSLMIVEKVKAIYLFETMERWIKPLKKTFEPWQNKIHIIHKYVSDSDSDQTITIDTMMQDLNSSSVFLKIDVEGAEKDVLKGASATLDSGKAKVAICTYHNQNDYEDLSAIMKNKSYNVSTTQGYMLFIHRQLKAPFFRRGMIHCTKD